MQMTMRIEGKGFDALANLAQSKNELDKQLSIVANKVAKAHRKEIGRNVRKELAISAKGALESIKVTKKARPDDIAAELGIMVSKRPSLKRFKARQIKEGVSYKISNRGKRQQMPGAFGPNIPRLGHHVYKRVDKSRLPIVKLYGVSVAEVYKRNHDLGLPLSREQILERMEKETARRIRALIVRAIRRNGRKAGLSSSQINQLIARQLAT